MLVFLAVTAFAVFIAFRPASASTSPLLLFFGLSRETTQSAESVRETEAAIEASQNNVVQFQSVESEPSYAGSVVDSGSLSRLAIVSWQGAKNCGESFPVTLEGGAGDGTIRFSTTNCSIFPLTGAPGDTFTVTVTNAGAYSLTAVLESVSSTDGLSDTKTGIAGRIDQAPLTVSGWGGAKDYYHSFDIQVLGGSTGGEISFETDGCSVSPAIGTAGTTFTVTVTRVGSYELTAVMAGNGNFNSAYSARLSGCSGKSEQTPIQIENWIEDAKCCDTFRIRVSGGSTSEALAIESLGCTVTKVSSSEYEVCITSVGPYAVTASRAGNYGYYTASAAVSGVAEKATSPLLSVSGWSAARNCNDSFPIHVTGGVADATIRFAATGCTVSPASGTRDTSYTVTVTAAGSYSLCAMMDETSNYESAETRNYYGEAGKGAQGALKVENWISSAPAASSFEITVGGGCGTGVLSVTTNDGCVARLKSGETNVYIVTVHAKAGMEYSLSVEKAGDASYESAAAQTLLGTTSGAVQAALSVTGWNENAFAGDPFRVNLTGGSGTGAIRFETTGCRIDSESGTIGGSYAVTVTALEGEPYSLTVLREGDGDYASASATYSGTVRSTTSDSVLRAEAEEAAPADPLGRVWIYAALLLLLGVVLIAVQWVRSRRDR